jgi:cell division transport system permease protein
MRFFIDLRRELREAFTAFKRNGLISLGCIVISTVALFSFSVILLVAVYVRFGTVSIGERLNVTAFFETNLNQEEINNLLIRIRHLPYSKQASYVSPQEALQELQSKFKELEMEDSPIPPSVRIVPSDSSQVPLLIGELKEMKGIASVTDITEAASNFFGIVQIGTMLGIALLLIFFSGFLFIVTSSTSISIFSFRKEIEIMQLLGASRAFVQNPFIFLGSFYGLLGGVIASALLIPSHQRIDNFYKAFVAFDPIPVDQFNILGNIMLLTILVGVLAGMMSAAHSVRRYLK